MADDGAWGGSRKAGGGRGRGRGGGGRPRDGAAAVLARQQAAKRRNQDRLMEGLDFLTQRLRDANEYGRVEIGDSSFVDFTELDLKVDHDKRPFWVTPTGSIYLEATSPLYEQARDFLVAICEPVSRPEFVHEYRLDKNALFAAASMGLTADTILTALRRLSKVPIGDTVAEFVTACTTGYGKVKLVLQNGRYYIESPYPALLRLLHKHPRVRQWRVIYLPDGSRHVGIDSLPQLRAMLEESGGVGGGAALAALDDGSFGSSRGGGGSSGGGMLLGFEVTRGARESTTSIGLNSIMAGDGGEGAGGEAGADGVAIGGLSSLRRLGGDTAGGTLSSRIAGEVASDDEDDPMPTAGASAGGAARGAGRPGTLAYASAATSAAAGAPRPAAGGAANAPGGGGAVFSGASIAAQAAAAAAYGGSGAHTASPPTPSPPTGAGGGSGSGGAPPPIEDEFANLTEADVAGLIAWIDAAVTEAAAEQALRAPVESSPGDEAAAGDAATGGSASGLIAMSGGALSAADAARGKPAAAAPPAPAVGGWRSSMILPPGADGAAMASAVEAPTAALATLAPASAVPTGPKVSSLSFRSDLARILPGDAATTTGAGTGAAGAAGGGKKAGGVTVGANSMMERPTGKVGRRVGFDMTTTAGGGPGAGGGGPPKPRLGLGLGLGDGTGDVMMAGGGGDGYDAAGADHYASGDVLSTGLEEEDDDDDHAMMGAGMRTRSSTNTSAGGAGVARRPAYVYGHDSDDDEAGYGGGYDGNEEEAEADFADAFEVAAIEVPPPPSSMTPLVKEEEATPAAAPSKPASLKFKLKMGGTALATGTLTAPGAGGGSDVSTDGGPSAKRARLDGATDAGASGMASAAAARGGAGASTGATPGVVAAVAPVGRKPPAVRHDVVVIDHDDSDEDDWSGGSSDGESDGGASDGGYSDDDIDIVGASGGAAGGKGRGGRGGRGGRRGRGRGGMAGTVSGFSASGMDSLFDVSAGDDDGSGGKRSRKKRSGAGGASGKGDDYEDLLDDVMVPVAGSAGAAGGSRSFASLYAHLAGQPLSMYDGGKVERFEIAPGGVDAVKVLCLSLNPPLPLMQEYDFRHDAALPNLDIALRDPTSLRPYQQRSLSKMFGNNRARSGIIVLPCGAGKTLVGISAAATIAKSCIVMCPNQTSVAQWKEQFHRFSTIPERHVKTLTAKNKEPLPPLNEALVLITTYTMIGSGGKSAGSKVIMDAIRNREWGLLLLDEVHQAVARTFMKALRLRAHCRLGLTATLVREDGRDARLALHIGPKLYEANWMDLTRGGYLANVQVCEIACPMTPEFYKAYLTADTLALRKTLAVLNPTKAAVMHYLLSSHQARGDKIIIFSESVFALRMYAEMYETISIDGSTKEQERAAYISAFKVPGSPVNKLFLSRVGDVALDVPDANVIIQISSHFGSRLQEAQRMGRILRRGSASNAMSGNNSFFYTLVSSDTMEVFFNNKRRRYLVDQGYAYKPIPAHALVEPPKPGTAAAAAEAAAAASALHVGEDDISVGMRRLWSQSKFLSTPVSQKNLLASVLSKASLLESAEAAEDTMFAELAAETDVRSAKRDSAKAARVAAAGGGADGTAAGGVAAGGAGTGDARFITGGGTAAGPAATRRSVAGGLGALSGASGLRYIEYTAEKSGYAALHTAEAAEAAERRALAAAASVAGSGGGGGGGGSSGGHGITGAGAGLRSVGPAKAPPPVGYGGAGTGGGGGGGRLGLGLLDA